VSQALLPPPLRSVRRSPAPWAAACARRIGRGTRRSADPRRRRRSSAPRCCAASRRRPPSQPHGDPAAPGWHRARLNRHTNAAFADALRGAAGRRALSLSLGQRLALLKHPRANNSALRLALLVAAMARALRCAAVADRPASAGAPALTCPLKLARRHRESSLSPPAGRRSTR
jgi:hypothetical protein